ncbi:Protein kinase C conserved region 2 (CalB) [Mactra antiquata]
MVSIDVDVIISAGVQESDGNFFENFTALSWRQENKRLRATNEVAVHVSCYQYNLRRVYINLLQQTKARIKTGTHMH